MVHELDAAKSARFGGARTMLVPSPEEVRSAIRAIPTGETRTLLDLRRAMAQEAGADVTCPFAARVGWFAVARADDAPWWRVTRDGKAEPRLPGGEGEHRARLAAEGVMVGPIPSPLRGRGGRG